MSRPKGPEHLRSRFWPVFSGRNAVFSNRCPCETTHVHRWSSTSRDNKNKDLSSREELPAARRGVISYGIARYLAPTMWRRVASRVLRTDLDNLIYQSS